VMEERDLALAAVAAAVGDVEVARSLLEFASAEEFYEVELAQRLDMTQQEVRKILYALQDANLAHQLRTEELEEGGRRVYWRLNLANSRDFLRSRLRRVRELLLGRRRLEEFSEFYVCANDPSHHRVRSDEILPMLMDGGEVTCPVCGASLEPEDREAMLSKIDGLVEAIDEVLRLLG